LAKSHIFKRHNSAWLASGKKILVPFDGEAPSEKALRYAIDFAKGLDKEVILLKVMPPILDNSHLSRLRTPERQKTATKVGEEFKKIINHEQQLLSKKIQEIKKNGIVASWKVVKGDPAEKIIEMAHKVEPYMVVMGGRRLEGLDSLKKLGSVTRKVAENVNCGVFMVR
jgi:nucleotide-binding universal stress UspA family protein